MKIVVCPRLIVLLLVQLLVITGCAATSSGTSNDASPGITPAVPPSDTPNVEGPTAPIPTPIPDGPASPDSAPGAPVGGIDRADTVGKDVTNTVDRVKGRNTFVPRRGVFFSVGLRELERTAPSGDERAGSDSDITNLSIGYDQILKNSWVVGALVDISRREELAAGQADFAVSSDSLSIFLFSSLTLKETFDVSVYGGYGNADTASRRAVDAGTVSILDLDGNTLEQLQILPGLVDGDASSLLISAGVSIARRFQFGAGNQNQFLLKADADYSSITTDTFIEQGLTNAELAYREDTKQNVKWTLSGGLSRAFSFSTGVFVPAITLSIISENPDEDQIVADVVARPNQAIGIDSAPTDRSYGNVDFDLVWIRPKGPQFFGNLNANFQNDIEKSVGGNVGARLEF